MLSMRRLPCRHVLEQRSVHQAQSSRRVPSVNSVYFVDGTWIGQDGMATPNRHSNCFTIYRTQEMGNNELASALASLPALVGAASIQPC